MGIVANVKNKVSKAVRKTIMKGADAISEAAQLSEKQIAEIEEKRAAYLAEKPDMNSEEDQLLIRRILGTIGVEVYHAYLPVLSTHYTPVPTVGSTYDSMSRIAYFDITKLVLDVKENYIDKLVNVYHVMSKADCNIALIFNRTVYDCKITMAVVNNGENDPATTQSYKNRLLNAVKGNFPGTSLKTADSTQRAFGFGIPSCLNKPNEGKCIASVTNAAAEKSEKFISQSIEKLLDGVVPESREQEYTFILLATPVQNTFEHQDRLSELYTTLAPFSAWQTNFTYTTTDNQTSSFSCGLNLGASAGMQQGSSVANTIGKAVTDTRSHSSTNTIGGSVGAGGKVVKASANYSHSSTNGRAHSVTDSTANTTGQNTGANAGANFGVSFNRASNVNISVGKNEGITQSFVNHKIKHTMDILDMQMKRLEHGSALGMWDFAAYVVSEDYNTANHAAHMYLALTQGEESYVSQSAVNIWHSGMQPKETEILFNEIKHLQHPVFCLNEDVSDDWLMYPAGVDATTAVSGRELAYSFNFPRRSVAGFPVIECAEFGRNVVTFDDKSADEEKVSLGNVFHMHCAEKNRVELSLNSLSSHTFITGSTGSGKSNTIYRILSDVKKKGVKFLVIEPAKGEYKHIFGNESDVAVYGTNPKLTPLLRIDPFSFNANTHVLEHLDRLVEIFNVCWPMYAAMPAVLKNALEKSYEDCGWDLASSTNNYGDDMFPNFSDVARNVKSIINESDYDSENKGAYKGSLLTRINSLTNGINGMIFTSDELSDKELFDENVIIDLSRVGSCETKSLIMGMLVLKLQEYRMTGCSMNSKLNHVTVLEEAHNILKRTASDNSPEGSNLIGKSVEMISNAIAEMRTYGEGFIVADQSPCLLDMAAIRNTNTKIIMRLPDQSDRELVGRAADLNDEQITGLAKLPCGAAAVYQNEWIQPVLCKVDRCSTDDTLFEYHREIPPSTERDHDFSLKIAEMLCSGTKMSASEIHMDIIPKLKKINMDSSLQVRLAKILANPPTEPKFTKIAPIISALFPQLKDAVKSSYNESTDERDWTASVDSALKACINDQAISDNIRRDIIQAIITDHIFVDLGKRNELQRWFEKGGLV